MGKTSMAISRRMCSSRESRPSEFVVRREPMCQEPSGMMRVKQAKPTSPALHSQSGKAGELTDTSHLLRKLSDF